MQFVVALFVAAASSVPAFALSYYLVSGRGKSIATVWAGFLLNAPVIVPIYFVGALVFGAALWFSLKAFNLLSLPTVLVGSVVPVLLLVFGQSALRGELGPDLPLVLFALELPCIIMALVLWFVASRPSLNLL